MKYWRYQGPERKAVLEDTDRGTVEELDAVMRRIVGFVPRKLGPARVDFHVIESPTAYDSGEIGLSMERLAGVLQADIINDSHRGEGPAMRLADFICTAISKTPSEGIRFGPPAVGEGHPFLEDTWRIQVSCPWHVDILSARN